MKILMLTPYLPYPLYSGGQIRTYNLLKNLSHKHQITLVSFIREEKEKKYIDELKKFCEDVYVFKKRKPWSLKSLFISAISIYPLVVCLYLRRMVRTQIATLVTTNKFDLIHAETFYVLPNIPKTSIPTILVEQTIEYLVYKHYTETVWFWPAKLLMLYDVFKIRHFEKKYWREANRVVAMSEADKTVMKSLVPGIHVDLVPNGVDSQFFKLNRNKRAGQPKTILFVGQFKWLQNREAVEILLTKIWPLIQKKMPDTKLWIVGRSAPESLKKFESDKVTVSSNIKTITDAYLNADVMLAPIYGPGGTRYKILESMACGLPVVTTEIGIEGLNAIDGRHVLIGNKPEELAQKTIDVLSDKKLSEKLASEGRAFVEKNYNWKSIAGILDRIYEEAHYA
jgi:glycosyltransferase involved in cell wall biosynthesis